MRKIQPVPVQSERRLEPALWKGKTLLCDLDDTLIRTVKSKNPPRSSLRSVNESALRTFGELSSIGTKVMITTSASRRYAEAMVCRAGLLDVVDAIFPIEELAYQINGKMRIVPKNYAPAIKAAFEESPLDNCLAIGDNAEWDIPIFPMGMLGAICNSETDFLDMFMTLERIIRIGGGSFAKGFDRILGDSRNADFHGCDLVREDDREFIDGISGLARMAFFENDQISRVRKLLYS